MHQLRHGNVVSLPSTVPTSHRFYQFFLKWQPCHSSVMVFCQCNLPRVLSLVGPSCTMLCCCFCYWVKLIERTCTWAFLLAQSCTMLSCCCCQGRKVGLIQQYYNLFCYLQVTILKHLCMFTYSFKNNFEPQTQIIISPFTFSKIRTYFSYFAQLILCN